MAIKNFGVAVAVDVLRDCYCCECSCLDQAVYRSVCHNYHCHCWIALMFRLHLEGGRHGDKDVDRERAGIVVVDKGLLRSETNMR